MLISEATKYIINDIQYITIEDFCTLVERSRVSVNSLIREGNKHRKLKCIRPTVATTFIPVSEYFEYPFTEGNKRNNVYNYTASGFKRLNEAYNKRNKEFDDEYNRAVKN
jgi:hypothetical protein